MKKLLIAGVVAVSLAAPFVAGGPVREAQARPDCQAADYNSDGYIDVSDVTLAGSLPGAEGRLKILAQFFGQAC